MRAVSLTSRGRKEGHRTHTHTHTRSQRTSYAHYRTAIYGRYLTVFMAPCLRISPIWIIDPSACSLFTNSVDSLISTRSLHNININRLSYVPHGFIVYDLIAIMCHNTLHIADVVMFIVAIHERVSPFGSHCNVSYQLPVLYGRYPMTISSYI